MIFELVKDFAAVLDAMPEEHPRRRILKLLEEAIRRDAHFIDRHPTTLFQCMWNTCWWYDCPEAAGHYVEPEGGWTERPPWEQEGPKLYELLETWRHDKKESATAFPWLRACRPSSIHLDTGLVAVFHGHEQAVASVACSPDGQRIVSGSHDGTIRVWAAETGSELCSFRAHEDWVNAVAVSPDSNRLASGSRDGTVRVWDLNAGLMQFCMRGHQGQVTGVAFSPDGGRIASSSEDKTVRLWDAVNGAGLAVFLGHANNVRSIAFSPDGRSIVSGGSTEDKTVRVWNANTGKELSVFHGHQGFGFVNSVGFSRDGSRIVSSSGSGIDHPDDTVRIWDAESGTELACLQGHGGDVTSAAFSPDGRHVVSGSEDETVRVWDVRSGTQVAVFRGSETRVNSVCWSQDGSRVISASGSGIARHRDNTVRVWDVNAQTGIRRDHSDAPITKIDFSPDGRRIVSGSYDGTVCVWDAESGAHLFSLHGHEDYISSLTYSADSRWILSGSANSLQKDRCLPSGSVVRVWDAESGAELTCLRHEDDVLNAVFSPDGRWVASGSNDRTVRLWDVDSGTEVHCLRGHTSSIEAVAFSPDGRCIISSGAWGDQTVRIWDCTTGAELTCLRGHTHIAKSVDVSPDCRRIVSGSVDGTVRVWDAKNGAELLCLRAHEGTVATVAFSADGRCIVSASESFGYFCRGDNTVRIWSAEDGECLQIISGIGDASSIAGALRSPGASRALLAQGFETVLKDLTLPTNIGWYPLQLDLLATHPSCCRWAGSRANHLYLIQLESDFQHHRNESDCMNDELRVAGHLRGRPTTI